jgi:hypothetical protein
MAGRWIRGITANSAGVGDATNQYARSVRDHALFVYFFMRYLLGWTHVDEQSNITWVFDSAVRSGSDGVTTGSDLTFTSAGGSFAAADANRWLVIVDTTNESNSTIVEIASYVSPTQVTLNWQTSGGIYPVAATGLTYYVIDGDANGDPDVGDYFVLQSPHATSPCTVKGTITANESGSNGMGGIKFEISPTASAWDAVGHTWNTNAPVLDEEIVTSRGFVTTAHGRFVAYGDTDGSFVWFWAHHNAGTGNKQGCGIAVVDALDPTPTPDPSELVLAFGMAWGGNSADTDRLNPSVAISTPQLDGGYFWTAKANKTLRAWGGGWRDESTGADEDYFKRTLAVNHRTTEHDTLPWWWTRDAAREDDMWGPWGGMPTARMILSTAQAGGENVSFDSDQYLHCRHGVTIPWPGIPYV